MLPPQVPLLCTVATVDLLPVQLQTRHHRSTAHKDSLSPGGGQLPPPAGECQSTVCSCKMRQPGPRAQRFRRFITRLGIVIGAVAVFAGAFCVFLGAVASNVVRVSLLFFETNCIVTFAAANAAAWGLLLLFRSVRHNSLHNDDVLPSGQSRSAHLDVEREMVELADNVAFFVLALDFCFCMLGPVTGVIFGLKIAVGSRLAFFALCVVVAAALAWVQAQEVRRLQLFDGMTKNRVARGLHIARFLSGTNALAGLAIMIVFAAIGGPVLEYFQAVLPVSGA